ncbi:Uncharacterized protein Adt_28352 [Abeliophyllum distichum]|uniref:Uncharacterized protein n=1 Tax=Abeliophyllum distichum TaxID=126358 RepID=A0ABD1RWB7_9LAMI
MIVSGNDEKEIAKHRAELLVRFEMKDLGTLSHFLVLEVENLKMEFLYLKRSYAEKMVEKFMSVTSKKCSTPLDANLKLRQDESRLLTDPQPYRALVICKKQDIVYLSTTDVEYNASSLAAQECVWLRRLSEDVNSSIYNPSVIHGDNQSSLKLATDLVCHARTKHIRLEHHFTRERVLDRNIKVSKVHSKANITDIITKSLSKRSFEDLRA